MFFFETDINVLREALEIYSQECADSLPNEDELEKHIFSEAFENKMMKLIKLQKKTYYQYINTVGKRVASIVAVFILCLFITIFSVKALREPFVHFIVETYEKFTSIFVEKETTNDNIEFKVMVPQYIPEGYVTEEPIITDLDVIYTYFNNDGLYFIYTQDLFDKIQTTIDTEKTFYEKIQIDSLEGIYYENKGMNCLVFNDGTYNFSISGYISKDEIIKIAESIK